ncbi:hypothetical protein [Geotoga petraea]|jgi:hypothetical protein|uniref:Flagellar protein FlgJ N-terminal domain-containing protein n=1 Tax=Geotoga petraea TaxID=28234 RepID=A0A1G6I866_9BACT|nr:hypothetical protein [Geotoga petraea]MDK2945486.1 rRNA (adenine-N6)-dimethyltransferase [Geotoga sp.]TGG89108.1 hypothetical protein E4650_02635 [Geotoga petraea]SDC02215.1 hypothetical protein SAMN04488588_0268 [Geotoga petraea]
MIGAVYNTNISYTNTNIEETSEQLVSSIFSKILNQMNENPLFEEDRLIPKSNTEKWFNEMINAEYSKSIAKTSLKPLTQQIIDSFNKPQR